MAEEVEYMRRCLFLARNGAGSTSPNPMVGAVIVHDGKILSEAFHRAAGESHAEALAIDRIKERSLLPECSLYVNLEPCCHQGRTPACTERILEAGIGRTVFGSYDPNPQVAGKGVERLKQGGCEVEGPLLEEECEALNRRFFTFHRKERPFIILKWARTQDGLIDRARNEGEKGVHWITGARAQRVVHSWRAEEDAILVGKNTVEVDDPSLTTRFLEGKDPLRVLIDRKGTLSKEQKLFNDGKPTLVFTQTEEAEYPEPVERILCDAQEPLLMRILTELRKRQCLSLIVEGGAKTLDSFIKLGLWDEARILTGDLSFGKGKEAPGIEGKEVSRRWVGNDRLVTLIRDDG